jgi:hypothetical protein
LSVKSLHKQGPGATARRNRTVLQIRMLLTMY